MKNKFKILSESINNQSKFNSLISNLISEMNIDEDIENPKNDQVDENKDNKESKSRESEKSSKENKQENQEMSIDAGVPDIENLSEESNNKEETVNIEDSSIDKDYRSKREKNFGDQKYKVYTEEFDETVKAEDLEGEEELNRLRQNLDQQLLQLKIFISKLANRLQRKLLAKQNRSWEFDLEEGTLDTSKLTRIIIDPFNSLSFKKRKMLSSKIL